MADQNDFSGEDSWAELAQRQKLEASNAAMAERVKAGQEVWNGLRQVGGEAMAEQRQKNERAALYLLSGYKLAAMNRNGVVPSYAMAGMRDALGYNGNNGVLEGAVINPKDGSFGLVIQDGNGKVNTKSFRFAQMYNMALENPGVFTRDELRYLRDGSIRTQKLTPDMANRDLPPVPDNYGQVRTPVGERTPTGGVSVPGSWLYGPQRRANISAFGANGRGGFTNYDSNEDTGYQLQMRDSGTRAAEDKGRWKVLSRGADPNSDDGTQITRYENDKTGEVVSVRDGETPPWESRAVGEKERIARINADGKIKAAEKANETKMSLAEAANALKQYGIDVSAQLKERGLDIQQQNADERSAHNQAIESQQAENEKGRADRAKQANETKRLLAEFKRNESAMKGRRFTANDYTGLAKLRNEGMATDEQKADIDRLLPIIAKSLEQQGQGVPNVGKTEVKQDDNGSDDNSPSVEYPGYSKGKAKRAIAAGWTWNEQSKRFDPPRK